MSTIACPFKPVKQREAVEPVHVHQYLAQTGLGDGVWIQDCACGHRRRVQKAGHGDVVSVFDDAVVEGGSSVDNAIYQRAADGQFVHRWQRLGGAVV